MALKPLKPLKPLAPRKKGRGVSSLNASSHIEAHEYDPKSKALTVTFRGGRRYRYAGVHPAIAEGLANATSKGSFMHAAVIGKHDATKL